MSFARMRSQKGQGLVGFVVAAVFVLVPSMLAVNYLARVGDARHRAEEAARYALWERTVWQAGGGKSDQQLAKEALVRIYGTQSALLDSTKDSDLHDTGARRLDPNLYLWQGKPSQRQALLQTPEGDANASPLSVSSSNSEPKGSAFAVANGTVAALLQLDKRGFVRTQVATQLAVPALLAAHINNSDSGLALSRHNAMLVESWHGEDPRRIRKAVERTLPTELLDNALVKTLADAAALVGFDEFDDLDFGHVDAEIVPCQRLVRNNGRSAC